MIFLAGLTYVVAVPCAGAWLARPGERHRGADRFFFFGVIIAGAAATVAFVVVAAYRALADLVIVLS